MKVVMITVMAIAVVVAIMQSEAYVKIAIPPKVISASTEAGLYQAFLLGADRYMKNYTGGAATIYWNTIRSHPEAPKVNVPPDWRIVVAADRSWVACTSMSEQAVNIASQYATMHGATVTPYSTGHIAIGTTDWSVVSKCQ